MPRQRHEKAGGGALECSAGATGANDSLKGSLRAMDSTVGSSPIAGSRIYLTGDGRCSRDAEGVAGEQTTPKKHAAAGLQRKKCLLANAVSFKSRKMAFRAKTADKGGEGRDASRGQSRVRGPDKEGCRVLKLLVYCNSSERFSSKRGSRRCKTGVGHERRARVQTNGSGVNLFGSFLERRE